VTLLEYWHDIWSQKTSMVRFTMCWQNSDDVFGCFKRSLAPSFPLATEFQAELWNMFLCCRICTFLWHSAQAVIDLVTFWCTHADRLYNDSNSKRLTSTFQ